MRDVVFDPIKTGFTWVDDPDGGMGWYDYDPGAEKEARRDRDAFAREQRKAGKTVRCSTSRGLRSMGGIGTNRPHIELIVPHYRAMVS